MRRSIGIVVWALSLAGLAAAGPALAQEVEREREGRPGAEAAVGPAVPWEEQIEGFFERVEAGEPVEAIDTLYAGNPWVTSVSDQLSTLKTQFGGLSDLVGGYLGNERLAVRRISDRFVYAWYIGFYERQPLQFHFSFYRPDDRWLLYQLSYEEGVVDLAQELARDELAGRP